MRNLLYAGGPKPRCRMATGGYAWSAADLSRFEAWRASRRVRRVRVRVHAPDVRVASERVCSGIVAALESDAELLRRHGGLHTLALECLEMLRRHPLAQG